MNEKAIPRLGRLGSVLFVAPRLHTNYRGWIEELSRNHVSLKALVLSTNNLEDHSLVDTRIIRAFRSHNLGKTSLPQTAFFFARFARRIKKLVVAWRPDVVMVRDFYPLSVLTAIISAIFCTSSIVIYRQCQPAKCRGQARRILHTLVYRLLSLFSKEPIRIVTPIWDEKCFKTESRGSEPEISILPFLVHSSFWKATRIPNSGLIRLLTIGKMRPYKRLDSIIRTLAPILRSHEKVRLTLIGECRTSEEESYREYLLGLIRDEGLTEKVELLSNLPPSEIVNQFERSSIFILGNDEEVASISILEACAAGLLCIGLKGNGTSCYFGKSEMMVDELDQIREKISAICSHPSTINSMAEEQRAHLKSVASPERFWRALEGVVNRETS